ncbi:MAG: ribosomal protein S18-alanine N-acetyltransferase [Salinigranum sp.]
MTGDEVRIRRAEQADLLDVFRIERASFPQPWPFSAFEGFLDEPGFLVAVRGAEVVGYVVGDLTPNYGRDIGHIKDLAVQSDARERGVGRALLERALTLLAVGGAALVKLEVRESNGPALSLYRDLGFEVLRRVQRYYADGEDALVMVLDVGDWRAGRAAHVADVDAGVPEGEGSDAVGRDVEVPGDE